MRQPRADVERGDGLTALNAPNHVTRHTGLLPERIAHVASQTGLQSPLLQRGRPPRRADRVVSRALQIQAFQPHLASGWSTMMLETGTT